MGVNMKKEVLDYINSMNGFNQGERIQLALVSLLYEIVHKEEVKEVVEPVVMALEEEIKVPKRRTKKKEV